MSDVPDFCPEGCYWKDCGHRAPLTVEERLHRAYEPSEATRQALATIDATDISVDGTRYMLQGAFMQPAPRPIWKDQR